MNRGGGGCGLVVVIPHRINMQNSREKYLSPDRHSPFSQLEEWYRYIAIHAQSALLHSIILLGHVEVT